MPLSSPCRVTVTEESPYPRDWSRRPKGRIRANYTLGPLATSRRAEYNQEYLKKTPVLIKTPEFSQSAEKAKFKRLAKEWKRDIVVHSSMTKIATHPAYQKIIGMGSEVLPFLFEQLKSEGDEPDNWFWDLAAITDKNPVPKESRGRINEMAKAWLEWGRENGYVELA